MQKSGNTFPHNVRVCSFFKYWVFSTSSNNRAIVQQEFAFKTRFTFCKECERTVRKIRRTRVEIDQKNMSWNAPSRRMMCSMPMTCTPLLVTSSLYDGPKWKVFFFFVELCPLVVAVLKFEIIDGFPWKKLHLTSGHFSQMWLGSPKMSSVKCLKWSRDGESIRKTS